MAHNTMKILFWLYKGRENKQGEAPLMLRISHMATRKQIATGYYIKPSKWDVKRGKVRGNDDQSTSINTYIQSSTGKLNTLYSKFSSQGEVDLEEIFQSFLGKNKQEKTLMQLVQYHNMQVQSKLGGDYSQSTYEKYLITEKKIAAFIQAMYGRKDIKLKDLKRGFISEFDFYLKTTDKNEQNTVAKYCKNLKRIINLGISNGWLDKNPFDQFKTPYKAVEKVYLSEEELQMIANKLFRLSRLELVRDLFLFQCYTGLAFADMAKLTGKDISIGIDGNRWIITHRKKTSVRSSIPLLFQALKVIEKYNPLYKEDTERQLLPVYSNQKYNSYLHEIADICGINKNLTSHVGRRTFATTVALANGVSIETVSKILGHTSIKMTQEYAMVTDVKVGQEMSKLQEKMVLDRVG